MGSNPLALHINLFFLKIEEICASMISSLKYVCKVVTILIPSFHGLR